MCYSQWLGTQDVVIALSWPAGARMFVDYTGDRMPLAGTGTGEVARAEVFVAVRSWMTCGSTACPWRASGRAFAYRLAYVL